MTVHSPSAHVSDRPVYPTQPEALAQTIDALLADAPTHEIGGEIVALIVPDSNLLTGGPVAAAAFKLLAEHMSEVDTVAIVAPSHDGSFDRITVCRVDEYRTPLGAVPVNDMLRNELCDEDDDIFLDDSGHYHTEGVDVQVPFLQQVLREAFSVVPIVMGHESPTFCHELGVALGEVMYGHRMVLIATADLLSVEDGALERFTEALESFDTSTLMHLLGSEQIRMEGMGPVITAVIAAQRRRANCARILELVPPSDDTVGALACVLWRE
jgi:MEMO1 family protein